ncbi:unnamed protein product [Prunus armeniaca]
MGSDQELLSARNLEFSHYLGDYTNRDERTWEKLPFRKKVLKSLLYGGHLGFDLGFLGVGPCPRIHDPKLKESASKLKSFPSSHVLHLGWGRRYTLRELEAATNGPCEENVIGEGGYGIVYSGILSDGTKVAVKNLLNNRQDLMRNFGFLIGHGLEFLNLAKTGKLKTKNRRVDMDRKRKRKIVTTLVDHGTIDTIATSDRWSVWRDNLATEMFNEWMGNRAT